MLKKIVVTNKQTNKTATFYIAADALLDKDLAKFDNIQNLPGMDRKDTILLKLAIKRCDHQKSNNGIYYISAINPPLVDQPDAAQVDYYIKHDNMWEQQRTKRDNMQEPQLPIARGLAAAKNPQVINYDFKVSSTKYPQERDFEPSCDTIDAPSNEDRKNVFAAMLPNQQEAEILVTIFDSNYIQNYLSHIKNQILEERVSDEVTDLNQWIFTQAQVIHENSQQLQAAIDNYVLASYEYRLMNETLAIAFYNAAKDYFRSRYMANIENPQKLEQDRVAFNALFAGIAQIDESYKISSVTDAIKYFSDNSIEKLQTDISNLLNKSYTKVEPDAFSCIEKRLGAIEYKGFNPVNRLKLIQKHDFKFSQDFNEKYAKLQQTRSNLKSDEIRSSLTRLRASMDDLEKNTRLRAETIKGDIDKKVQPKGSKQKARQQNNADVKAPIQPNFWQRNKATILSIGLGVLIGAGAAVAFVFLSPYILPIAATAGIIAGGVALVLGASALIGRAIDKHRNKKPQIDVPATKEETQSLLGDDNKHKEPHELKKSRESQLFVETEKTDFRIEFRTPGKLTTSKASLFATDVTLEKSEEEKQERDKIAFESDFVQELAKLYSTDDNDMYHEFSDWFRTAKYNIDNFIKLIEFKHRETATNNIAKAISLAAEKHTSLSPDAFSGRIIEPEFGLAKAFKAAGKREDHSPKRSK